MEDKDGVVHKIRFPHGLLVPGLKHALLLPQHWAQEAKDYLPKPQGTMVENDAHACTIHWNRCRHRKTIPFNPLAYTPAFYTAPSAAQYRAFEASFLCFDASITREQVLRIDPATLRQ